MATATKAVIRVEGHELTVTNPDKLLWPERGITKALYLEKLMGLAPHLLRYCRDRHLTTIRYPGGIHGKSFYQKNCPDPVPSFVRIAPLGGIRYINLDSVAALLWLGNLAALEFHPSFHYIGSTLPAEWLIDIDPSREIEPRIMEATSYVGEALDKMHIRAIPKTSGATGVQLYIPLAKPYTFEQLRAVGQFLGRYLTERYPKLFTIERLKKNRGDRIYVDYLQHWHGKTLSCPYTPRAREAASVSAPLEWSEVEGNPDPRDFHLLNIEERLRSKGDLIAQATPQNLDRVLDVVGPLR